ncbi:thermonuclease family protein [Armatimonas sp.]|uniref:thermonuclease family protein n=1 Tax=Armatimonas sp. TaxID=1872638 RepID=UPI003752325E
MTEIERGDQLSVQLDSWVLKVRLHGIECPHEGNLAAVAKEWTQGRILGQPVQVGVRGTAAKGIVYGDVSYLPGAHNIAIELTEQGLATWSARYAPTRRDLAAAQARAQAAHAGVWGNNEAETVRLRQQIKQWQKDRATPAPITSPAPIISPAPTASPAPRASPTPAAPTKLSGTPSPAPVAKKTPVKSPSLWPMVLGILGAAGLLTLAERVSRDARRLRQRPTVLADAQLRVDAQGRTGPLKFRGLAHAAEEQVASIAGHIPGLYVHEITQIFREGTWRTTYNETDACPFILDDGSGEVRVSVAECLYKPIRIARFYNDIPVERWHAHSYGGDIRTEVFFIPSDVTLVLYGELGDLAKQSVLVIEGDERRLTLLPVRAAIGLIVAAVLALLLGGYFTVSGAG